MAQALESDHYCVLSCPRVAVRPLPPAIVQARYHSVWTDKCPRLICKIDCLLQISLLQRLTSRFTLSSTSMLRPPSAKSRHAARRHGSTPLPTISVLQSATDGEQERRWQATGLTVRKDLYNTAKRLVVKLAPRANVAYFSTEIVLCSFSKQLRHVTNQLADRKKPQVFFFQPAILLLNFPSALLAFFFETKSEQNGLTWTVKHQSLTPLKQSRQNSFLSHSHAFNL